MLSATARTAHSVGPCNLGKGDWDYEGVGWVLATVPTRAPSCGLHLSQSLCISLRLTAHTGALHHQGAHFLLAFFLCVTMRLSC